MSENLVLKDKRITFKYSTFPIMFQFLPTVSLKVVNLAKFYE